MQQVSVKFVFGQSNAVAAQAALPEEKRIRQPLTRVFTLPRVPNQAYSPAPVVWQGYTSFDTNLGETQPDNGCFSTEYARLWQQDAGLPPLYIITMAIGAQGVTSRFMWYPERERRLVPGTAGTADVSLYPLSCDVMRRALDDLRAQGLDPVVSGLEWLGGEEEDGLPLEELDGVLPGIYDRMLRGWREAAGCRLPVYLYHVRSYEQKRINRNDLRSIGYINDTFDALAASDPDVFTVDPCGCPLYDPSAQNSGLYFPDLVHYLPEVNLWLARNAFVRDQRLLKVNKN